MGKKKDTATPAPAIAARPELTTKPDPAAGSLATANGNDGAALKKKKPAAKAAPKKKPVTFSTEDIALRAYFIAEARQRQGLPGDEHSDWLEAERQLRTEQRKKAAKKVTRLKKRA